MSAPKEIYAIYNPDEDWIEDHVHVTPVMAETNRTGKRDTIETYVHASELKAVQARLEKLVEAAAVLLEKTPVTHCSCEDCRPSVAALKSAIKAAKGGE